MRRWLLLLLLALAVGVAETPRIEAAETPRLRVAETPRVEVDRDQHLVLTDLPGILADEEVKEHLTTGLTTSFQFVLRGHGQVPGGARVEIRYDLWDEVFLVAAGGIDGQAQRQQFESFEALETWWRSLELVILDGAKLAKPWPERLRITVDVVPFSQSEKDDTQRWFSESIDRGRRSGVDETGRAVEKEPETLSRTFNLLLATSIRRQAIVSYRWTAALPPSGTGDSP